jgi:hypothetical protein
MQRSRVFILAGFVVAAGCSGTDGTTPGVTSPGSVTVMSAASPTTIMGDSGEAASTPPSVQVRANPGGRPVAGVKVVFSFSDGRGADYSTTTNSNGVAVLANLHFDIHPGQYNIIASVAGIGSVTFSAISFGGQLIATYDLRTIGGKGPPFTFEGESIVLSGGHYQLFDDGTYRAGYDENGQTTWRPRGPYIRRNATTIEFYLDPSYTTTSGFYVSRNYLFAVGAVTGDQMKVTYQDSVDYLDEEYSLGN